MRLFISILLIGGGIAVGAFAGCTAGFFGALSVSNTGGNGNAGTAMWIGGVVVGALAGGATGVLLARRFRREDRGDR